MNSLKHIIKTWLAQLIGRFCEFARIDLLNLAHSSRGIGQASAIEKSGELNFIERILPTLIAADSTPVLIDVGANEGEYSLALSKVFPSAKLYAFEPNPALHQSISLVSSGAHLVKAGLSNVSGEFTLATPIEGGQSLQSSFSRRVSESFLESKTTLVPVMTLDQFFDQEKIDRISFLKIDVEGLEMEVLQGASRALEQGRIDVIQFEFNEVNIRVGRFLEEFYAQLVDFDFYRITLNGLYPLGHYHPKNEIFLFQNIVVLRRGLKN